MSVALIEALRIAGILAFAWCFIFSAVYAAIKLAQRPRRQPLPATVKADLAAMKQLDHNQGKTCTEPPNRERSAKLTRAERKLRKQHPQAGPRAIRPAPGPRDWTQPDLD